MFGDFSPRLNQGCPTKGGVLYCDSSGLVTSGNKQLYNCNLLYDGVNFNPQGTGGLSTSIGAGVSGAIASGSQTVAIGSNSQASGGSGTAVGVGSHADGTGCCGFGNTAQARANNQIIIGYGCLGGTSHTGSIFLGSYSASTAIVTTASNQFMVGTTLNPIVRMDVNGDATGFSLQPSGLSSTSTERFLAYLQFQFGISTDASYTGRLVLSAGDFSSSFAGKREGLRLESDGTQALLGFYGATAVAQPSSTDLLTAIKNLGLVASSVTAPAVAATVGLAWEASYTAPPAVSTWTWVNQGTATATDVSSVGIRLVAVAASGNNAKALVRAVTGTWTVTARLQTNIFGQSFNVVGLLFRESSSGKLVTAALGTSKFQIQKYTNPTTFSAEYTNIVMEQDSPPYWIKLQDDGTNRIVSVSRDGVTFYQVHSVGRTDFLTADQVGFFVESNNGSYGASGYLLSWVGA